MKQWKGFGDQSFDPGITLKEIAESLEKWSYENVGQFNTCTKDMVGEGYILAPYKGLSGNSGVDLEEIQEMWKWIQSMDKGAYNTINWLLINKTTLLIIPPPPPPPPPGDDD